MNLVDAVGEQKMSPSNRTHLRKMVGYNPLMN